MVGWWGRCKGAELTLTELHVLTASRQGFSRPSQTGDLGLWGIWLVCERLDGSGGIEAEPLNL